MGNPKRFIALLLTVTILMAIGVSVFSRRNTPALAAEITMEPTKHDSAGIDLDTEFSLSADDSLDPGFIRDNLTVEPRIDFVVKRNVKDKQKVTVIPKKPLDPQMVYKFALSPEGEIPVKWAFQTKGDFKVISTLPRNESTGVPTGTGIEINFSHLNFEKLPEHFSISPKVEGTFEIHKKTAVFVPKNLEHSTLYTVTISKGLPLAGSDQVLKEDFVFQFETEEVGAEPYYFHLDKSIYEFGTSEEPLFLLNYYSSDNSVKTGDAELLVYRYKDAREYIKALIEQESIPTWAYRSREKYRTDISQLEQVAKILAPIKKYDYTKFVELSEPMPPGYYLANVTIQGSQRQVWFQVTDLSIYAAGDKDQTYVWVNDIAKGSPVPKAKIELYDSEKTALTDNDGLVKLETPQESSRGVYAIISQEAREAVATVQRSRWDIAMNKRREIASDYWKYLYLDRMLYKPDDIINFWGLVTPRAAKAKSVEKVTVVLSQGGSIDNAVIESKEVKLDDFVFTGSLKLPNLSPGYYYLMVKTDDDVILSSSGFEVQVYSKPAYTLEAEPNKKAIFAGDTVDFKVNAAFFEGTAAAHIPLEYFIDDGVKGNFKTDDEGNAHIKYSPKYEKGIHSPVLRRNLYLTAKLPESGDITGFSQVMVLNNDIEISASSGKPKNGKATLDIVIDKLSIDKVNSNKIDPWDPDAFKDGSAPNKRVKIQVFREVWEKQEAGEYYDFINKRVETRYNYQYKKVPETTGEVATDQNGKAVFTFPIQNKESYVVEVMAQDFRGNPAIQEIYVLGPDLYREFDYTWYNIENAKTSNDYVVGEKINLSMKRNEAAISPRPKGFLFFMCRNGILGGKVQDTTNFNTTFDKGLIPNFWVKGIYFDGRYYHEASEYPIYYNKQEKALNLKVTTDKGEYKPKDTVKVEVKVTDKNGKPVKAKVNLNLVDEALYALQDQQVDILSAIYDDHYGSGIEVIFMTHEPPFSHFSGAEQGGEGGSERKDFRDAVLFKTLTTDNRGKAAVSFEVPDNLTTWRLTCQAVTKDLAAGTKTAPVVVRQPFFVDMVLNNIYLVGDKPIIPLRASGDSLKAGSDIRYETVLKSGDKTQTEALMGKAFSEVCLPLPSLTEGKYELTVTGKTADGLVDTLTLDFAVVNTLMTREQVDFALLDEKLKIKGAEDSMTTLSFADYQRSQYLDMLWRLQWSTGSRIDQKIAPRIAGKLLKQYFSDMEPVEVDKEIPLTEFQTPEGGIAILPYGGADLELSTKLAVLYGKAFDRNSLSNYFYKIADDPSESRERSLIALCGLSALDEPVLNEILILSREKDLTVKEQIYLSLALMELGDEPSATRHLKNIIQQKAQELGSMLRINPGGEQDDILEATAMTAVLAAGLNLGEQNRLQAYVIDNTASDILLYIEQLMFLGKVLPRLTEEETSFNYTIDGKEQKVVLKPGEVFTLHLAPEKLATLKFGNIKGKMGVTALYNKENELLSEYTSDGVKMTRKYEVAGNTSGAFDVEDLIKIHITYEFGPTAPDGPYLIYDFLPAGVKIASRPYQWGMDESKLGYPVEVNGQKITFVAYEKKKQDFYYYARAINSGKFKAEPAVIQHMASGKVYGVTKSAGMELK